LAAVAERLAEFLRISAEICVSLDLHHTLTQTCEQAVAYFNVQHSALLLFSPDYSFGTVFAEFPENFGAVGNKIPVADIVHEERMIEHQTPIAIYDVEAAPDLGPVKPILQELGIRSILIVPIIHAGKVFGSFSLDVLNGLREFTEMEVGIARKMAEMVARQIATAEFFDRERLRAEKLDALRRSILAINTQDERPVLLKTVVANAAELLKAQSAGLYEYNSYSEVLTIVA